MTSTGVVDSHLGLNLERAAFIGKKGHDAVVYVDVVDTLLAGEPLVVDQALVGFVRHELRVCTEAFLLLALAFVGGRVVRGRAAFLLILVEILEGICIFEDDLQSRAGSNQTNERKKDKKPQ